MKKGPAAVLFAAAALFFLNLIVPPFQNPDEPHHFAAAVLYARGEAAGPEMESGVIRMMDRANWWRLVGIGRPSLLPERIADIPFLMEGSRSGDFRTRLDRCVLWHRAAGIAMRPVSGWSLERLYYLCRGASALFFAVALFFFWKALEVLAGIFGPVVKWAFPLVFFLPQLLLTGTSVSPDSFVLLLSGLFFYGAASLITGQGRALQALLIMIPAMVGLLTDRSAFFLAALAVLVPILMMTRKNYQNVLVLTIFGSIAGILLVYGAALAFPLEVERIFLNARYVLSGAKDALPGMFKFDPFTRGYWVFLTDGFLLKFGWLVFDVPRIFYWLWRLALAGVVVGLIARAAGWARRGGERKGLEGGNPAAAKWILFSIVGLGIQAVGVWVYYGNNHFFGQGRYFHPLIVPLAIFAVLGLDGLGNMIRKGAGRMVVAGAIVAEFLLLTFSVWHDIVPAFHLILRGPHPGV